jgi:hypothetical protein
MSTHRASLALFTEALSDSPNLQLSPDGKLVRRKENNKNNKHGLTLNPIKLSTSMVKNFLDKTSRASASTTVTIETPLPCYRCQGTSTDRCKSCGTSLCLRCCARGLFPFPFFLCDYCCISNNTPLMPVKQELICLNCARPKPSPSPSPSPTQLTPAASDNLSSTRSPSPSPSATPRAVLFASQLQAYTPPTLPGLSLDSASSSSPQAEVVDPSSTGAAPGSLLPPDSVPTIRQGVLWQSTDGTSRNFQPLLAVLKGSNLYFVNDRNVPTVVLDLTQLESLDRILSGPLKGLAFSLRNAGNMKGTRLYKCESLSDCEAWSRAILSAHFGEDQPEPPASKLNEVLSQLKVLSEVAAPTAGLPPEIQAVCDLAKKIQAVTETFTVFFYFILRMLWPATRPLSSPEIDLRRCKMNSATPQSPRPPH